MKMILSTTLISVILLIISPFPEESNGSTIWNQWRGSNRDGTITGGNDWPKDLKENHLRLKWRMKLGSSYSGPVLDLSTVYVTESIGNNEAVHAIDRTSGQLKWTYQWNGKMRVPFFARRNGSWIRSTPALANGKLFVAGMRDHLICLDINSGEKLWEISFPQALKTPLPKFGCISSPMVDDRYVYLQAGAGFVKIAQETGQIIWHILRDQGGMYGSAFSSPVFAQLLGKRQILVQTRFKLAGVDINSGKVLWHHPVKAFRGMNILTPLPFKKGVYTNARGSGAHYYTLKHEGNRWKVEERWAHKSQGYMSTPVMHDNHAYIHLRNKRLACYSLNDGKEVWMSKQRFGKYMSFILKDENILALDERGLLYLIQANSKELIILDSRRISNQNTWAHLAISNGQIAIRELNGILLYDWGKPSTKITTLSSSKQ